MILLPTKVVHPGKTHIITTTAAATSTMQIVEYHVKYNTTTDQTHLKQTTVAVGIRVNLKSVVEYDRLYKQKVLFRT